MRLTTILSSKLIKEDIETDLAKTIKVDHWLTPKSIPYKKDTIVKLLNQNGVHHGNVILFVQYGKRNPADFPEICVDDLVLSLVFYKTVADIVNWMMAIKLYSKVQPQKVLTLAMMKPLYMKWGEKIYQCLRRHRYNKGQVKRHFADTTTNVELGHKLSRGCTLAIYVGHGRSRGWSGYRGFRWRHLEQFKQTVPIGSLISLSCNSLLHDKKESLPMGLQLIMEGRSCTFFGTWDSVHIVPLRTITKILLAIFTNAQKVTVGELIADAHSQVLALNDALVLENWLKFRLIGSPFQII